MAGGFSVAIGSDTRIFEQGVRTGVIEPVEDAQDALQDLARSGDRAGDGLGRGLRDGERALDDLGDAGRDAGRDIESGMRDADRALDRVGDAGREAGDDLEDGLRDAQRQTGKTAEEYREMAEKIRAETARIKAENKETFEGAGGATGEFREEALANFSEVTSSFSGDMSSITDLAQGTFGGLASMGGPAAFAFGAIAVAVGLIGSALTSAGEESDEFQEKVADLAQTKVSDMLDEFGDSGNALARGLRKWASDAETFGGSLTDLKKNAKDGGLAFGDLANAIATDNVPAMRRLREETDEHIASLNKEHQMLVLGGEGLSDKAKGYQDEADAAKKVKTQLDQNLSVYDAQQEVLKAVAQAQGQTVEQYLATEAATKAAQDAQDSLTESLKSMAEQSAESTQALLDNSALNADQYIADTQKRQAADDQYYANLQTVGQSVPQSVYNYLSSMGDSFSQELATYLSASPEQQAAILETWKKAAGSGQEVEGPTLKAKADASDVDKKTAEKGQEKAAGPTSQIKGDTKDVDKKVDEKSKQKADGPTLKLRADDSDVDKALSALRDKRFNGPTAVFQVDRSSVNAAISDLRQTQISIRVKAVDG